MSLLDEIRVEARASGPTCTYRRDVIEPHPELDEAARQALAEGIQRSAIIRFLLKKTSATASAAGRHLRGECRCPR